MFLCKYTPYSLPNTTAWKRKFLLQSKDPKWRPSQAGSAGRCYLLYYLLPEHEGFLFSVTEVCCSSHSRGLQAPLNIWGNAMAPLQRNCACGEVMRLCCYTRPSYGPSTDRALCRYYSPAVNIGIFPGAENWGFWRLFLFFVILIFILK